MATGYNVNYSTVVQNLLPINKRLANFISYLVDLVYPVQWDQRNFFNEYANGSGAQLWTSTGTYAPGDRLISWFPFDTNIDFISTNFPPTPGWGNYTMGSPRGNGVYECNVPGGLLIDGNTWPALVTPQQDQGTGARLIANIDNTGAVSLVGIKNGGSGYGSAAWVFPIGAPTLDEEIVTIGLNYDNNNIQVNVGLTGFAVTSVTLVGAPGENQPTPYIVPPTVVIQGLGTGAKVVPLFTDPIKPGIVTAFEVIDGGSYFGATGFVIGGTTTGAGTITSTSIITAGTGYTEAPQLLVGSQWSEVSPDFRGATSRAEYNASLGTLTWLLNEYFHTTFRNFNPVGSVGLYGWGSGDNASATANLSGTSIMSVIVTSPGSGYASTPTVLVSDPNGTGAELVAVMSYPTWIAGTSYSIGDSVSFQSATYTSLINSNLDNRPTTSSTAWQLVLNSTYTGQVQSVRVIHGGSGYTSPTIQFIVPGVVNPPGGGTAPFQQAHSDIFITRFNELANDIFYFCEFDNGNPPTDPYVSYWFPFDSDSSGTSPDLYMGQPLQYWGGTDVQGLADFIVWVPRTSFWNPLIAQGNNPNAIVRNIVDQYNLAGVHYFVLPY